MHVYRQGRVHILAVDNDADAVNEDGDGCCLNAPVATMEVSFLVLSTLINCRASHRFIGTRVRHDLSRFSKR